VSIHPEINTVVDRIRTDVIGGAADTAKEVTKALMTLIIDSSAKSPEALVDEVDEAVLVILRVLPSLAPPINALHRLLGTMEDICGQGASVVDIKSAVMQVGNQFLAFSESALAKVAQFGSEKINNGDTIFMYSMSSSVWRILRKAKEQGKSFNVAVTESRPANEGLWTVTEMEKAGIPVSVSIDACIGELIPQSNVVFVGADAISSYGCALCKVGTYPSALIAHTHGVPFYIAADTLKFDTSTLLGLPFRIDPIHRHEVLDENFSEFVKVTGTIFDETPSHLITAIITEIGLLHPSAAFHVMWQMKLSQKLSGLLPLWVKQEL
jgi:ribose 1,5-bisphosphate isomerase